MKKLMLIAAAVTIVGGAFAQCSDPEVTNCSLVYDFKASLKTTAGKAYSGDCEDLCYRATGSKSFKGYIYTCECECTNFMYAATYYLYDKKSDTELFGAPTWQYLNAIGKKSTDAEGFVIFGGYGGVLYAAGHGKFDDAGLLKSMSGDLAGYLYPPYCAEQCSDGEYAVAYPACSWQESYGVMTPAFGSWSIKYNKSLSSKYSQGLWVPPVPDFTSLP